MEEKMNFQTSVQIIISCQTKTPKEQRRRLSVISVSDIEKLTKGKLVQAHRPSSAVSYQNVSKGYV